jgi:hypothetical protein
VPVHPPSGKVEVVAHARPVTAQSCAGFHAGTVFVTDSVHAPPMGTGTETIADWEVDPHCEGTQLGALTRLHWFTHTLSRKVWTVGTEQPPSTPLHAHAHVGGETRGSSKPLTA